MNPFKLQSVLDYRHSLCNVAQQELCETIKAENSLLTILNKERLALDNLYAELDAKQKNGIKPHELAMYECQCQHKTGTLKNLEQKLFSIRKTILVQRQNVCEADRDKKLLVKLKEKQTAAFTLSMRRKENSTLDEIAIQRHGR